MDAKFAAGGGHFGKPMLIESSLALCLDDNRQVLNANLNGISQCVIPSNNRDDLEIQFTVSDERERQEDCLVQVTLHFPDLEREDDLTEAEAFHQSILDAGLVKSITGDVIVEFTKEQGDFVAPRGRYSLQLTASYFYMQGAQYAFRIPYDDINSFFLLPKPDGGHEAFVISLNKPIKQGNQRYQHLVLNPHTLEQTVKVNITPEENEQKYEGQLQPEMTMPLHNLIAKLFKVLANKKVFVSKQFLSARDVPFIRCSIKANDGLLYPLAKAFIFIHKPTLIIKFDDIDHVEFKRYEGSSKTATRSFDLAIALKDNIDRSAYDGREREFVFMSIDRIEYPNLVAYIESKSIEIKNPVAAGAAEAIPADLDDEDEDEDDENYSASGSESSGDDQSESESDQSEQSKKRSNPSSAGANKKQKKSRE